MAMRALILLLCLLLPACTNLPTSKVELVDQTAAVADQVRDTAELVTCRGITVGAWVRKYGQNPKLAEAWRILCGSPMTETPAAR